MGLQRLTVRDGGGTVRTMIHRIEVAHRSGVDDPRGIALSRQARTFLGLEVERIVCHSVYKFRAALAADEVERLAQALCDPIEERVVVGRFQPDDRFHWVVRVGLLPGVTDNVGHTARTFLCDLLGRSLESWPEAPLAFSESVFFIEGPELKSAEVARLVAELLHNPMIESAEIWSREAYAAAPVDRVLPLAGSATEPGVEFISLPVEDDALLRLSRERTLSLSLEELKAIAAHYADADVQRHRRGKGLGPQPTDVELEVLAQTWSEHCKHKIFNATVSYTDEHGASETITSLFKTYIVGATREVEKRVPWLVSVFDDNAGVTRLTEDTNLVYKVETHNSPSALDPYGGAMTGIVGVNRDPFGTGIGAALLTNVWGYCFASPRYAGEIPEGLHHPRRIRDGVHRGVIEGGNQSGIPYSRGFEYYDDRFLGKPLVFCGTVGVMPAVVGDGPSERKEIEPGDAVVMVGGRIGKDGIHGATFSSEALHVQSPAHAVQIGDPITQKMMTDMLLEARDQGLYRTLTDNGAGGLSSSVGEMARICNGARLDLDHAPLKYPGLAPWEILVSEAQERMSLAVPQENVEALLALAKRREVEATVIGTFEKSGRFRAFHRGELVADLDMDFLHEGCPRMQLTAVWQAPRIIPSASLPLEQVASKLGEILMKLVSGLNLCSREEKRRQYDHEVKGLSVVKPLVGVHSDIPSDCTAMRVCHGKAEVVLLAEGIAPRLSNFDPGVMASYVVDLAVRRIIAGGGRLGAIAGLDNFCWPDPVQSEMTPDGHQKMAGLVRACRSLYEMTTALDVPLISGKDSMKNDSTRGGVKISIPPTLLFSAMGWADDASQVMDLRADCPGQQIFVVGDTHSEIGGGEFMQWLADELDHPEWLGLTRQQQLVERPSGPALPHADPTATRRVCEAVQHAIAEHRVRAVHAPHLGGIGVGVATMALAADLGVDIDLSQMPCVGELTDLERLYSESCARFLVVCEADKAQELRAFFREKNTPAACLGQFTESHEVVFRRGENPILRVPLPKLRGGFSAGLNLTEGGRA